MIKNIIFDLGNVLVNVEYERFINAICTNGVSKDAYLKFFKGGNYRLLGYEAGEITTAEFIEKCRNGLGLKMSDDEFTGSFNDMFTEIPEMSSLVRKLDAGEKHNMYLLSNTSPLHFEYIKKKYDYVNLLDKFALSYELKSLKPDDEIYERTITLLSADPKESLFIDDLPENCMAAEKFGFKTICYDKYDHTKFEHEFDKILNK
ncbi:MAG: HAD family phosphatase [Ignavibacteria bacterium]|nr:HAD family phosphatase [Ignavibacteria bacterium]